MIIFLGILYFLIPLGILYLTEKNNIASKIGAVIIAYVLGLILGHIGVLPRAGVYLSQVLNNHEEVSNLLLTNWLNEGLISPPDIMAYKVYKLQDLLTSITIPLALPLLLFSLKIRGWFRMSGKTMLSMVLALVAVVLFIVLGHVIFGDELEGSNKIAGMLVGLYTGGTPNLASLQQSLGVDAETYIMTHTYDTAVGVVYLLFLITVGKNLFRTFLPAYPKIEPISAYDKIDFSENAYKGIFKRTVVKGLLAALGVTILIVGVSAIFGAILSNHFMLVVILSITSFGIVASFIPKINKLEKTFELGMYFIIVFSFVVASMADIHKLVNISSALIGYITLVYAGALVLHALFSKLFKVDADTLMVTSTALLCSPPFVPMVAGSLKNKEVIVSGLTVGIMGYAIGNYLGAIIAAML